ncbi:c-type cytochrome [Archangium lipolyticum]|uniref:c-type cytochrome n=1 Tax=Archangium lipolyticum TaxID=2970465 RepID=UPI002149BF15|nr:c-type cytochrome [Archangium lipolyticum]
MGTRSNRTLSSRLLARTAPLSMALALFACSDKPADKTPPPPSAASVFKDEPRQPESPSVPAPPTTGPTGTAAAPQGNPPPADAARTPEQLFANLGCRACHGPGSAFVSALANARTKEPEVIAMWILDPQKVRPGTMMPSFAGRITTQEAISLAKWIKAGNPPPPSEQ